MTKDQALAAANAALGPFKNKNILCVPQTGALAPEEADAIDAHIEETAGGLLGGWRVTVDREYSFAAACEFRLVASPRE